MAVVKFRIQMAYISATFLRFTQPSYSQRKAHLGYICERERLVSLSNVFFYWVISFIKWGKSDTLRVLRQYVR
jgi:hypothetical protein